MILSIHITDNSDTIARDDSMKTLFLEKTLQPTLPLTQTTPPPLIGLSSCDHLYISNILPASKLVTVER